MGMAAEILAIRTIILTFVSEVYERFFRQYH